MAEDVEQRLLGHGLKVKSTPRVTQAFQISESELQSAIEHEVNYGNPRALEYDINSIRSVYELRGGFQPRRLEDARAVLLTENTALARAAFEFGKKHAPGSAVSAVITDFSLANVAWLKAPAAIPDLPEREVLSACYAALEPDQATWAHYLEEIDRLEVAGKISSDEHQLLRYSALAREGVADLTIGREQALTAGDVDELMKRLKHDMSRAAEAERAKTQRELYLERSRAQTMKENERRMISRIGVLGAWLGRVGRTGFLLCMAGVFFLISLLANGLLDMYAPKLSGAHMLLGIFLLLTAIFWAFDFTPKGVGVRIGRCVERMAIRRLRKWLNVSPDMDPREHELHE